uniref:probable ascorbate-specific transmembrane electron transporter 1 n=1 Tax=Erigeron canadensis TaxID=72917 RepID=UPI001CB9A45D|nr:probable ascorbate-specific transmembrane electron transporter 1 [Erigeron canadensis]
MATMMVTMFTHLLVISIISLVLYWLINFREGFALTSPVKMKIFNLHPLLMVLGFIIFSGEAMIIYKAIPARRQALKVMHLILHLIALGSGIFGVYTVFKFHNELNIPHMYTLHSWIGLSTISLFGLQWLLGFATFLFPGAESTTRAKIAPWHIFFGVVIFLMAIVTAETGLTEKFIFLKLKLGQEALVVNFIGILILLYGIFVGLTVALPLRRK